MQALSRLRRARAAHVMMVEDQSMGFNVVGARHAQIKDFCIHALHCWPVKVFAFSMLISHLIMTGTMVYLSSQLYREVGRAHAQGLRSRKFYRGGGALMVALALAGVATGLTWSILYGFSVQKLMVLTGSLMTLFIAVPLAGSRWGARTRRGFVPGSFGGLSAGMAVGTTIHNRVLGLIVGGIAGFVCGGLLGMAPVTWTLDMTQRYIHSNHHLYKWAPLTRSYHTVSREWSIEFQES